VNIAPILLIYFVYGLAFFSMGLLVMIEGGRTLDARLRRALRPLGQPRRSAGKSGVGKAA